MDAVTERMIRSAIQDELSDRISRISSGANDQTVKTLITQTVEELAAERAEIQRDDIDDLIESFVNEFLHLGPLQPLLADPEISEIMVNGAGFDENGELLPHEVWIERNGLLERAPEVVFDDEEHVRRIMNRIVGRIGRHMDEANPIEDASLADGSRFNGTLYPIAPDGSTFNIRRFQQDRLGWRDLVDIGTATVSQIEFLATCVKSRLSILVSGGTGSGKTTLLNVLGGFIEGSERIVTIEDTCELLLHRRHPHVVRFEARKRNAEGAGEVTLDDHLVAALRKRPDRIIVGECRGPEAATMLEAMSTGHDGSMTTIHANDTVAALTRLVTLVKSGDRSLSEDTVRAKIADALDIVVQVQRLSDGVRRIVGIEAVGGYADGVIQHEPLWVFERAGIDDEGHVIGRHVPSGAQPSAVRRKIEEAGYEYDCAWLVDEAGERR